MPLPSNLTTITLTGEFLTSTGTPMSGTLSFTPPPELVDVNTAIMYAAPDTVTLDSTGKFTTVLICTDNPTLAPAGWSYTVQENVSSPRTYTIFVPSTLGTTVDLSTLVPLPTLTGGTTTATTMGAISPGYAALAYGNTFTGSNVFSGPVSFGVLPTLPGGSIMPLDWINAKSEGTKGDGVTDDTAALQAALTACPQGGAVYLPAGVYRTSAPLIQRPYTRVIGCHGNGQYQQGGASPFSSIKPLASFAGSAVIKILDGNLGGYTAPAILASPNTGTYQVVSAEYGIESLSIDGSALTASAVDGINATGQIQNIHFTDVDVQQVTGNGINLEYNLAVTAGPQAPFCVHMLRVAVQSVGGHGIVANNTTDSTFLDCYTLGCSGFGWWIAGCANALFLACRGEWSGLQGFHVGLDNAQMQMIGCSTDRNTQDGMIITTSGATPGTIVLTGFTFNRDGRNYGGAGGSYAGLNVNSATCRVVATDLTVIPGYDDNGTGTLSPQYGVSCTSAAYVSIASGVINGATAAWNDGGGNTTLVRGPNVLEAVGQGIPGAFPGMELTRSGATVNGTLTVTGATTLAGVSAGGQKITSVANGTAPTDVAAFGQIPTVLPPSGAASGDLGGSYPNPTLIGTANVESIIRANRLDQMAIPTVSVAMNSQKFTGVANGTAATDSAAFGQIPVVDSTATHVLPLGVQAAGSNGKWADSGHVHPFSSGILSAPVTVTGVSATTLLFGGPTLAAGSAHAGMIYTFELWGTVTTTVDTQTVELALYWGGVSGTLLANVGPNVPNGSATVSSAAWKARFSLVFQSSTTISATGEDALNYFPTTENQIGIVTISNTVAEQLAVGVIPSATAVSITANGGWWNQSG